MPQATFVLKNPSIEKENKNNPTLIYLFFTFNKSRLKYSTGQKVPPKYWNSEKQRVKLIREFRQAESINNCHGECKAGDRRHGFILSKMKPC